VRVPSLRLRLGPLLAVAAVAVACGREESAAAGGGLTTTYGRLSDSVVRLPSGDSVEFQATGPAIVDSGPPGLLVTYFPFSGLTDTLRVRAVALEFFRVLRPRIYGEPAFVAMRAVDVRAADRQRVGLYTLHSYGVVVERRGDGKWYVSGEAAPLPGT
jgi:hypothetical protein